MKYIGKSLRSIGNIIVEGEAIVTKSPITLLGFVDAQTGKIVEEGHDLNNQSITNKIFVFPRGVGSTVGPYVLLNLVKNMKGPLAIINRESDQGTIAGSSVARIPMAYGFEKDPTDFIRSGNQIKLSFKSGKAEIEIIKS